jgi:hypothetical protein
MSQHSLCGCEIKEPSDAMCTDGSLQTSIGIVGENITDRMGLNSGRVAAR